MANLNIPVERIPCLGCQVYHDERMSKLPGYKGDPSCCKWYMDNVICGSSSVRDCPTKRAILENAIKSIKNKEVSKK